MGTESKRISILVLGAQNFVFLVELSYNLAYLIHKHKAHNSS